MDTTNKVGVYALFHQTTNCVTFVRKVSFHLAHVSHIEYCHIERWIISNSVIVFNNVLLTYFIELLARFIDSMEIGQIIKLQQFSTVLQYHSSQTVGLYDLG